MWKTEQQVKINNISDQSPGWDRLQVRNQFILQSQLHGLACSTRVSSRGAVTKVSLGRVVRVLLDKSRCLQEGNQSKKKKRLRWRGGGRAQRLNQSHSGIEGWMIRVGVGRGDRLGERKSSIIFIFFITLMLKTKFFLCSSNTTGPEED